MQPGGNRVDAVVLESRGGGLALLQHRPGEASHGTAGLPHAGHGLPAPLPPRCGPAADRPTRTGSLARLDRLCTRPASARLALGEAASTRCLALSTLSAIARRRGRSEER